MGELADFERFFAINLPENPSTQPFPTKTLP
jgi:hypothetical protein